LLPNKRNRNLCPASAGLFFVSAYQKATTKIMVTDFILPLTVHAIGVAFVFHEASAVGSLLDLGFMTAIPVMLLDSY
jgi:hypothetical protein